VGFKYEGYDYLKVMTDITNHCDQHGLNTAMQVIARNVGKKPTKVYTLSIGYSIRRRIRRIK